MSQTESTTYSSGGEMGQRSGWRKSRFRSWSALEIAIVVGAFMVWWPLGLVTMFVKWKKGEMWRGSSSSSFLSNFSWENFKMNGWCSGSQNAWKSAMSGGVSSGNSAFDAYKKAQLERLEEERRRLNEEQKAFADYLNNLRQAKDKEEFDRFMAERRMMQRAENDIQI